MIQKISIWSALLWSVAITTVSAQSTVGLTGIPDTSFTNRSAYLHALKGNKDIKLVVESPSTAVKETRDLVYCTIGNRKLHIDAFEPAMKPVKPRPAVLIIHGGGWRSGNRGQHIPLAQSLAKAGYTAFTVEYRLSTEALYPAAINDVKSAIRWIRANASGYQVNPNQLAVLGFSAGGEMAAFMGGTAENPAYEDQHCLKGYSTAVQAVIDIDGTLSFVHPESGEGIDKPRTSAGTAWFGYSKLENPELWAAASPLKHVETNKAPFLFINSSVARMHAGRDDFRKVLDKNNIYSEVHTFEGSPHTFCLFEPWFTPTLNHITSFLAKVFK